MSSGKANDDGYRGMIQSEQEFKEALQHVLSDCQRCR